MCHNTLKLFANFANIKKIVSDFDVHFALHFKISYDFTASQ